MSSEFDEAVKANGITMFDDVQGVDVAYTTKDGTVIPSVRVLPSPQPVIKQHGRGGEHAVHQTLLSVSLDDVADPIGGDTVVMNGETWTAMELVEHDEDVNRAVMLFTRPERRDVSTRG